jgi:hypothetical protein
LAATLRDLRRGAGAAAFFIGDRYMINHPRLSEIINHPKLEMARSLANKNNINYCLVANDFGDFDIKKSSDVSPYVNNPKLVAEICPSTIAQKIRPVFKYSAVTC